MSGLYTIPISGLKHGQSCFEFKIDTTFFERFEESEAGDGEMAVTVGADKRSTHVDLDIVIKGTVRIKCDRCLEVYSQPLECSNRLLVKFGKAHEDDDPDMIVLPADEHDLDLTQYLYEYIMLALPIKRMHPDDSRGNSTCDPEMLRRLQEHLVNDETENDPRWNELKKLMNNN